MNTARRLPTVAPHRAAWIGLLIALGIGLGVVLRMLAVFWAVILLAVVSAGLLGSWYHRLVAMVWGSRRLAAAVICLLLVVALLVPLFLIGREVSQEALAFYEMSTTQLTEQSLLEAIREQQPLIERTNRLLRPLGYELSAQHIYSQIATLGVRAGGFFYKQGVSIATGLVRFVIGFLIWLVILYHLLVDGRRLRDWFHDTLPLPSREQDMLSHRFMDMASSLVIGNGVAATVQAVIGGLLFAALNLPGPTLWGLVMWILAFIPVIGISFVYIPAFLLLLLAGQTGKAFAVLIVLLIVATLCEYWLKPALVGRRAKLNTLLVFLSLLGGLDAFGAIGLLLGPLMMTAFLTLVGIYQENYRPFIPTRRRDETLPRLEDE